MKQFIFYFFLIISPIFISNCLKAQDSYFIGESGKTEKFYLNHLAHSKDINNKGTNAPPDIYTGKSSYNNIDYLITMTNNTPRFIKLSEIFNTVQSSNDYELVYSQKLSSQNILLVFSVELKYLSNQLNSMFGIDGMNQISRTFKTSSYYKFVIISEDGSKLLSNKNYLIPVKNFTPVEDGFVVLSENLCDVISLGKNDLGKKTTIYSQAEGKNIVVTEGVNLDNIKCDEGVKLFKFNNSAELVKDAIVENPTDKNIYKPVPLWIYSFSNMILLQYVTFENAVLNEPTYAYKVLDSDLNIKGSLISSKVKDYEHIKRFKSAEFDLRYDAESEKWTEYKDEEGKEVLRTFSYHSPDDPKHNENTKSSSSNNEVTDIDGNIYKTVKIGTQTWMAENLKTTRYRDSSSMKLGKSEDEVNNADFCYFNFDSTLKDTYGVLYSWDAIRSQKLCPNGWHIPTKEDWEKLINFLESSHIADREFGKIPELNAVSGGYYLAGHFYDFQSSSNGRWWSSSRNGTIPIVLRMWSNFTYPDTTTENSMIFCFVRCLKND